MKKNLPRGQRNNNPFNIRRSKSRWIGKIFAYHTSIDCPFGENYDPDFEQFYKMEFGIRAGLVLLSNYVKKYRLFTLEEIIDRFAPAFENDTLRYVSFIRSFLRSEDIAELPVLIVGSDYFFAVCRAIMVFESSYRCSQSEIRRIYNKYFKN